MKKILSLILGLSVLCSSVFAQGQGSYGGYLAGLVSIVLLIGAVLAFLALLGIRVLAGTKVALICAVALLVGLAVWRIGGEISETRKMAAYQDIQRSFAEGCARTTRTIFQQAKGNERIFVRVRGQELLDETLLLRNDLPLIQYFQPDIELVSGDAPSGAEGIHVDLAYQRGLVPGSFSGYEWQRVGYRLKVIAVPGGHTLAEAYDMQSRNGMCLGHLEGFMRKALNRPAVFKPVSSGSQRPPQPTIEDAVVTSGLAPGETGQFLKTRINEIKPGTEVETAFTAKGCVLQKSTISPTYATCGDNEVWTDDVKAMLDLSSTHLLVRKVDLGTSPLSSLRIEHRDAEWKLLRAWVTNFVPSTGPGGNELLDGLMLEQGQLSLRVYSDREWSDTDTWFARKSLLRVPLPGLIEG